MAQATFSVRMDEVLKKQFDGLCQEFGMNASTAINVFARAVVRQRRIPFEISADSYYPERDYFQAQTEKQVLARIDRSLQHIKEGKYTDAREAGKRIRSEYGL